MKRNKIDILNQDIDTPTQIKAKSSIKVTTDGPQAQGACRRAAISATSCVTWRCSPHVPLTTLRHVNSWRPL